MKKLLIISFVSWLINVSCNNSNDPKKDSNTTDKKIESSQTTAGAGKGTISCLIDGKQRTFDLQGFTEINLDPYSKGPHKMTWNGFTLSPTTLSRTLQFDKNFNPIQ